jgi:hypothetical protein
MADNTTLCEPCNKVFLRKCDFTRHLTTTKHKKCVESPQPTVYTCDNCNFSTETLCFWNRHIATKKHITNITMNGTKLYKCETCEREDTNYKTHWAHRQKCAVNPANKVYNKFDIQFVIDEIYKDSDNILDAIQRILTIRNEIDNYITDLQNTISNNKI